MYTIVNVYLLKMKKYLAFFFVILIGCKPIEPVEFREFKNIKIDNLSDNKLQISSDLVLNNPNKVKIILTKINLEIFLDGIQLVKIQDEKQREIKGNIESEINIVGDINIKNLESFLNQRGISLLLTGENPNLKFLGDLEVKVYGFKETISIDYSIENLKGIL